uniref:U-box domain-containing protein 4 n=1 Tax=Tanacetum cinerariifolium TaxID=118510 RepID=A0A699H486_TANCI|nr:U-box domain-containing protein 4 [Tanacetum cinerariifolium]
MPEIFTADEKVILNAIKPIIQSTQDYALKREGQIELGSCAGNYDAKQKDPSRGRKVTLTIVEYGHDAAALSPDLEEGGISQALKKPVAGMAEKATVVLNSVACVEEGKTGVVYEGGILALAEVIEDGVSVKWNEFVVVTLCNHTTIIQTYVVLSKESVGKENRLNILKSINEGPFQMGTVWELLAEGTEGASHLDPKQPRIYYDLSPKEKDRFVTAVKLNKGLRDSNYDQLYAYLKQHETHANENKMMLDRFTQHIVDSLPLMSNVSHQQHYSQSSSTLPSTYVPPHLADNAHLDSGLSPTDSRNPNGCSCWPKRCQFTTPCSYFKLIMNDMMTAERPITQLPQL